MNYIYKKKLATACPVW